MSHAAVQTLADDCNTLEKNGGLHEHDRKRVKTGTGY
jgi:hypothetical protein